MENFQILGGTEHAQTGLPGFFFLSAHSLEPGNEAGVLPGGRALDDEV